MTIQLTPLPGAEVRVVMYGADRIESERLASDYGGDVIVFYRGTSADHPDHALIGTTDIITASTWVRRVLSLEAVR